MPDSYPDMVIIAFNFFIMLSRSCNIYILLLWVSIDYCEFIYHASDSYPYVTEADFDEMLM